MPDRVERARGANRNLGERKNFQRFACQNSSSPMLRTNVTPGKELCFLERKRKFTPFLYSALVQFLPKNSNFERDNNRVEDSMSLFKILSKQISTKRAKNFAFSKGNERYSLPKNSNFNNRVEAFRCFDFSKCFDTRNPSMNLEMVFRVFRKGNVEIGTENRRDAGGRVSFASWGA